MSTLSNPKEEAKEFLPRFKLLYSVIAVAFVIIFSRLWYLQIIKGQELRTYSEKNRIKETKIASPRGLILDRNGEILVENLPGFTATISPQYATKLEETAEALEKILDIPKNEIVHTVKDGRRQNGPFRPVKIKENLNKDEVARISALRFDHPGLDIQETILRSYPLKEIGAQLLGYVGEISQSQIDQYNKKYKNKLYFEQGDIIGKDGIEETWEPYLRGKKGVNYVEVDARGREANTQELRIFDLKAQEEVPGHNIVLTIDKDIQEAAYKAMFRDDHIGNRVGSLIAMKTNGEILAWASSPSYDPNEFSTGISTELWARLINDPNRPLTNKVVKDHFMPGSTFKPIVALAALQEKEITRHQKVFSPGSIKFGNRWYHDHLRSGHGSIDVVHAIERSSNVFFYKMGIALGIDKIATYAKLLGIGKKTKIKVKGEVTGHIPTTTWKLKAKGEPWQPGENLINAIGQGFVLTSTIQMVRAYNTIALEGKVVKPFLMKKIIDHNNNLILEQKPQILKDISIPPEDGGPYIEKKHFKTVKAGVTRVVNGDHGTARGSGRLHKYKYIKMAGKTGTVQVRSFSADQIYDDCYERPFGQRHHGFFVGFAPVDDPKITVAFFAEHACAGSKGAAPVVRDVVYAYLEKYEQELISANNERVQRSRKVRRAKAENLESEIKKNQSDSEPRETGSL